MNREFKVIRKNEFWSPYGNANWKVLWVLALCGTLVLPMAVKGGTEKIIPSESSQLYEQNIREGFAAEAGFEIINFENVRFDLSEGRRSFQKGHQYREIITYPFHPHPHEYSYRVKDEKLDHIKWVTLGWKEGQERSLFVFDLYLHGDLDSPNHLAIRVPNLDIRKFLHQSIAPISDNSKLVRLQAYFSEFSRKAKIIYPLPLPSSKNSENSLIYEQQALTDLRMDISNLVANPNEREKNTREPLNRILQELDRKRSPRLDVIYRNLQMAIEASGDHKVGRNETEGNRAVLERSAGMVINLTTARRISSLKIINNCREPGNYEVEIRDGLSRPLFRANFSFHTKLYNHILTQYHGLGIREQGTGIGVSREVRNLEKVRYWDSFLPWKRSKSFPDVTIDSLSIIRDSGGKKVEKITPLKGEIEVESGSISFKEYEIEVRNKSEYHYQGREALSYVGVDPELPVPVGFESPNGVQPILYWTSGANAGKVVPHHFRTFEDIQSYEVYLSEFDLNGVYIGQSELRNFEKESEDGRWQFNFKYLRDLTFFEFRQWGDGYLEIRLKNKNTDANAINFIFGNFSLDVGQSKEFLFGIGTQPLIKAYNHNVYQDPLLYGLAYGSDGTILDHHDQGIGVEKVYVERLGSYTYKIRLISYERILPVWEGIIQIPEQVVGEAVRSNLN